MNEKSMIRRILSDSLQDLSHLLAQSSIGWKGGVFICGWIALCLAWSFTTKYILSVENFPFPFCLTACQMLFSFVAVQTPMSNAKLRIGWRMFTQMEFQQSLLISLLLSGAFILENYAYIYLDVSFIYMAKLISVAVVQLLGHISQYSALDWNGFLKAGIMVIGVTTVVASQPMTGMAILLTSVLFESLAGIQRDIFHLEALKNPLTALSYFSPICAALGGLLSFLIERDSITWASLSKVDYIILAINLLSTFGVFALASVAFEADSAALPVFRAIKDYIIILTSSFLWDTPIGLIQWSGYGLAIVGQFIGKHYIAQRAIRITLSICAFGLLFTVISPFSNVTPPSDLSPSYGPLSTYLRSHGVLPDQTIYVSMASKDYVNQAINLKQQLDNFSLGRRLVVLCVDSACVEEMENHSILGYDGYLQTESESNADWHLPIARMKFSANLDLLEGEYDFVVVDGDAYLTGSHHPLAKMRRLSDPSWVMQFQSDDYDGHHPSINFGWYWARPCNETRELFRRCQEKWEDTHEWDQGIVNDIRFQMIEEGILTDESAFVIDRSEYARADVLSWGPIFIDPNAIDQLNLDSVMIHYTGFYGLLKSYMPKHFGHWVNTTYYTQPMSFLQPIDISGTLDEILKQMAFAIHLARSSGRTFMWPISLNQTFDDNSFEERPAIAVVDVQSVADAVAWVEGTYLHNRARYARFPLTEKTVPITFEDIQRDTWVSDMAVMCQSSTAEVFKVDFGNVRAGTLAASEMLLDVIQKIELSEQVKTWLH